MSSDSVSQLQAYCFKCREKRVIQEPTAMYNRAGAPATRGACPECGTAMYRTGATAAHEGLPKPAKVPRPARKKKAASKTGKAGKRGKSKARAAKSKAGRRRNIGKLVIVESPAKARSIGGFLGDGYTVMSSIGHVRDLLKSRLSVDIEGNFEPEYRVPNDKRAVVKELKAAAEHAKEIYLATDPDREGEAIAWHLVAAAEMPAALTQRVVFHEITDSAVAEAFAQPRGINMDLVNAQQARRILDRLVGYQVSRLLWSKVRGGLSGGRVQSVALRLVVEREKEIEAFVPTEYWTIDADLAKTGNGSANFRARLAKIDGQSVNYSKKSEKPPLLHSENAVQPHVQALRSSQFIVDSVKRGTRQDRPKAPFTTSTLQQAASNQLGFRANRTMRLAQQLYEGINLGADKSVGLITYMRTDSVQVSKQAQAEARRYIQERFDKSYLPKTAPRYRSRAKGAQEAHEAIRPTSVRRSPEAIKAHLNADQLKLYRLIWNRFVASQMANGVDNTLKIEIKAGLSAADMPYLFRASGKQLKFLGHRAISGSGRGGHDDEYLPQVAAGELLARRSIKPEQHHTQPPPRYTEASLIKVLEEKGIGRPSTYAPTVSTIQARDYVTQEQRKLKPTKTGAVVSDLLTQFFDVEMDYDFTAGMEKQLDEISSGKRDWQPMLEEFYQPFAERLENARQNMPRTDVSEKVGRLCPTCDDGELLVKHSRYGKFIGCSNYPECRHTERYLERLGLLCPQCGSENRGEVVARRTRKGRRFYGCDRYPECDFSAWRLARDLKKVEDPPAVPAEMQPSRI